MIRLVVFDLDGTLVDSHHDLATAVNAMVHEFGGRALSDEAVLRMVGEGAVVLVRRALAAAGLNPELPDALARFLALYDDCLLDTTEPYPGTMEMLESLVGRYRLAILTNKPARATSRMLDGLGLTRFFDPVIGGDTACGRKPDPAGLLHIIGHCNSAPDSTLMVGDSPIDLLTARRAGTAICLARFGFGYRFEPADLDGSETIIDAPLDLRQALRAGVQL